MARRRTAVDDRESTRNAYRANITGHVRRAARSRTIDAVDRGTSTGDTVAQVTHMAVNAACMVANAASMVAKRDSVNVQCDHRAQPIVHVVAAATDHATVIASRFVLACRVPIPCGNDCVAAVDEILATIDRRTATRRSRNSCTTERGGHTGMTIRVFNVLVAFLRLPTTGDSEHTVGDTVRE